MPFHEDLIYNELHKARFQTGLDASLPGSPDGVGDVYWAPDGNGGNGALYLTNAAGDTWVELIGAGVDASTVTYTPSTLADWSGTADPGNADDALDQLASRVTDNETDIGTNTTAISNIQYKAKVSADDTTGDYIENKIVAGTGVTLTTLNPASNETFEIKVTGAINYQNKTGAYTALITDDVIYVDATSAPVTITLPSGGLIKRLDVKKVDATANAVTIDGNGTNIDGSSTISLLTSNESVTLAFNGTNHFIL